MPNTNHSGLYLQEAIQFGIHTEYDRLKVVMTHRPGEEINRLTPENREYMLFEGYPYLSRLQQEHDGFCERMREQGVKVLYLKKLLLDILQDPRRLSQLVTEICLATGQGALISRLLDHFSVAEIAHILFAGITAYELDQKTGSDLSGGSLQGDFFLLDPIPNAYFTRDPAVIIDNGLISCKAHYASRVRETSITRAIFKWHPNLQGCELIYGDNREEGRPLTVEGGDILVINRKAIAIGCSERTRSESISKLAGKLFAEGHAQRVYGVQIPPAREYMHLDTVFSIIAEGVVVAYPNVIGKHLMIRRYEPYSSSDGEIVAAPVKEERSFEQILKDEFQTSALTVIPTGGKYHHRFAGREQINDGANFLALAPGKVIGYERNIHTNEAVRAEGIEVIEIEGSELVRGLGGPRCMSMPLWRSPD